MAPITGFADQVFPQGAAPVGFEVMTELASVGQSLHLSQ
jgi:hypothetical protein